MRVLHVIPSFAPAWRYGGPIAVAVGLTRELARQGHEVTVMTTNIDGPGSLDVPLGKPVIQEGVEVWYFPVERPRWYCYSRPLGAALERNVKAFDLVHIHSIFLWPTTIAGHWCRKQSVPYILRPAGSLSPVCLAKSYDRWWVSLSSRLRKGIYLATAGRMDLQRASGIHFTAEAEMEAARPLGLKPPGFVVSQGVELFDAEDGSAPWRLCDEYPQLQGRKVVLFLSRLDPIKGLDVLVPALGSLATRRDDFCLVVAGKGTGTYEAEVAGSIQRHGLQDRTIFLGFVQGKAKWSLLQSADVFVLPSYHENFGVAVVEAMSAGLPVVISDRVNICHEVSQAKAGLVTDLVPEHIATAIERLLADDDMRREMGQRGKWLVSDQFSWDRVAKKMLLVYDDIITRTRLKAGHAPTLH